MTRFRNNNLPAFLCLSVSLSLCVAPAAGEGEADLVAGVRIVALAADGTRAERVVSRKPGIGAGVFRLVFEAGNETLEATVRLGAGGSFTLTPGRNMGGVAVLAGMQYAVIPSRWLDQTIYRAESCPAGGRLHLPNESVLMGLAGGGGRMVVLAWPAGGQTVSLLRGGEGQAGFDAEVMLAGREVHVGVFDVPGIWHAAATTKAQQEKAVTLDWRSPFAAQWIVQLTQTGAATTFPFDDRPRRDWAPGVGSFNWPAWFEGDRGVLRVGKKVPHVGEALIFPLAEHDSTPFDFLKRSLSRAERRKITELGPTRNVYELVGPMPPYVWTPHCAGERRMKTTILVAGAHFRERAFLDSHIDERLHEDMAVVQATRRYAAFLERMDNRLTGLRQQEKDPAVVSYLTGMAGHLPPLRAEFKRLMLGRTPDEYDAHIRAVARRLREAFSTDGAEALAEMRTLLWEMNEPKNVIENFGEKFGGGVRNWHLAAAEKAVGSARLAGHAAWIRQAVRELLYYRGYEVRWVNWPDMR